jgi:hypothetical protein
MNRKCKNSCQAFSAAENKEFLFTARSVLPQTLWETPVRCDKRAASLIKEAEEMQR